ncbi:uncharacterized protein LOC144119612 [Amblyomma americanum]
MIASRRDAIYLIGVHMVPNLIGIVRFSYGFHRTGAPVDGALFDTTLAVECMLNIVSDALVILLLWQADRANGPSVDPAVISRALGVFVVWNTAALLFCCGANLAGLRYPPKWYTGQDADGITLRQQLKIVLFWAPWIILSAHWKLYYTTLLYEFYKIYEATDGKAFDEENLVHVMAGDDAMTAGPPSLRPTTPALTPFGPRPVIASPAIDPAIFNDPTPIFGRTPISGITPDALSPGRPWPPVLTPVSLARTPPPEPSGPSPRPDRNLAPVSAMATCPAPVSATSPGPRRQGAQRPTSSSAPTPSVQTTPGGLTPNTTTTTACSASSAPSGSKRRGDRRPPAEAQDAVSRTSGSVTSRQTAPSDLTPSQYEGSVDPAAASRVRPAAEPSEAEGPASRVLKARRPKPPKPGGRKKQ